MGPLYGVTVNFRQPTPGSGVNLAAGSPPPFFLGFSPDSSKLMMVTNQLDVIYDGQDHYSGANQAVVLNSATLTQITGSPFPLTSQTSAMVAGPTSGRFFLGQEEMTVLDGTTYQPVTNSPVPLEAIGLLAISPDETSLYAIGMVINEAQSEWWFYLAKCDATSLQITTQMQVGFGYFLLTEALFGVPFASLAVSLDGGLLFFIGLDVIQLQQNVLSSRFSVYNTATMQEVSWSPLSFGELLLPVDLAMSPDGTRLFVLAGPLDLTQEFIISLHAVDPIFS
jgi:hypothetical protein